MSKSRAFCFTINNPIDDESPECCEFLGAALAVALGETNSVKRFCFQFERGESGTLHLQGYVGFDTPSRWSRLQAIDPLFSGAHFEPSRGSPAANLAYCSKEEGRVAGPWECGDFPEQGQRSELVVATEIIQTGGSMKQLLDTVPAAFFKFHRGFEKAIDLTMMDNERPEKCDIVVFYGDPGTGKSFRAEKIMKGLGPYYEVPAPQNGTLWLDGYSGEQFIFFDECYFNISLHMLLQLLDRKPMPRKGGFAYPRAVTTIIITTMKDIFKGIYPNVDPRELKGFTRRLTAAYEFTGEYPETTITCRKYSPWSNSHEFDNRVPPELPLGASAVHLHGPSDEGPPHNFDFDLELWRHQTNPENFIDWTPPNVNVDDEIFQ